ncbi:MAG: hypothetical protein GY839_11340 [candidate division Zixibacteria bacterium]|nr:hypothetical protein [candidate division Zixibacteria bacterium]
MCEVYEECCKWVKEQIEWGAGNVLASYLHSEGKSKVAFDNGKSVRFRRDSQWKYTLRKIEDDIDKIAWRAGAAATTRSGNCEEHADLTFYWLLTNTKGLKLNYCCGEDHAYIAIGNPKDLENCIVVDPWPFKFRVGKYGDVRCQECKSFEVSGIISGFKVDYYKGLFQTAVKQCPLPEPLAKDIDEVDDYKYEAKQLLKSGDLYEVN